MRRKAVSGITLILLLVGMLILTFKIQPAKAEPETIYVDDDNTSGPWDGTSEHPCQNITSALEHASANDTIYVYNGTYSERVIVDKSISLIGEGEKAKTTIISDSNNSTVYVSANNVTISGFEIVTDLPGLGWGIIFDNSSHSTISGNVVDVWMYAILVEGGSRNKILDNRVVRSCLEAGLKLLNSGNNIVTGNNLTNCHYAFIMEGSNHNYVAFNNLSAHMGCSVIIWKSNNNSIVGNDIRYDMATTVGQHISFTESNDNLLYRNNFLSYEGHIGVWLDEVSVNNIWDDGYPSGGNYWSNYAGVDLYTGPYQNETGSDNIGDTPYVISVNNEDNYPLMIPYPCIHSVAVKDVRPSKTVIGQNFTTRIPVDIANEGHFIENLNMTIYANTTIINTLTNITLASTNSATITFTWNTTGFVKGNYTIMANATIVPNETYTDDNIYTYRIVVVTIPGDVNGNSKVNYEDLFRLADAYGSTPDDDNWDPECDINDDDKVNYVDLFTLADYYGT
jgi:parallel beta-helix repeat protein